METFDIWLQIYSDIIGARSLRFRIDFWTILILLRKKKFKLDLDKF